MKRGHKYAAMLVAIALGLVCVGTAFAQQANEEGAGLNNKKKADQMLKELNLSPQQEAQMKEFQAANRQKVKELNRTLREKRKALFDELDKPNTDMEKIKVLASDLKTIEGNLVDERIQGTLKMKEILSVDQYRLFSDALKKMRHDNGGKRRRQE